MDRSQKRKQRGRGRGEGARNRLQSTPQDFLKLPQADGENTVSDWLIKCTKNKLVSENLLIKFKSKHSEKSRRSVFKKICKIFLRKLGMPGLSAIRKREEKDAVKQLINGGDILAVLPTGFGKSFIFQLFR